jgi:hypothetical protein
MFLEPETAWAENKAKAKEKLDMHHGQSAAYSHFPRQQGSSWKQTNERLRTELRARYRAYLTA